MADRPSFQEKQHAFAAHIRDPLRNPPPEGVEDRRMAIYRELFFNNLKNLLSQTFPVLKKLHSKEKWNSLVRKFMAQHKSDTPYFLEIPQEFMQFLQHEYELQDDDFPFLLELAHYEWVELALSISQEENDFELDPDGDLLAGIPVKSRLAWSFSYRFPVHRISVEYLPDEPGEQPTFLAVCRRSNDDMDFMELNPVTARLLDLIADNERATGRELLEALAREIGYADTEAFVQHGKAAMEQMYDAEIIIGVK
jgi:hypothetical protein